jgi:hypothetical protein
MGSAREILCGNHPLGGNVKVILKLILGSLKEN